MVKLKKYILDPNYQLFIVLLFFLVGKILISGVGYLGDSDEGVYSYIYRNFDSLLAGNILTWYNSMELQTGPILETLIRFFQTGIAKLLLSIFLTDYTIYDVVYVLGGFNILVSIASLIVFYKILKNLDFDHSVSILGVILIGVFCNFNIYSRHILPYENGLLLNLLSLMFLTSKNINFKKILLSGIFFALAIFTYNGYFMFLCINVCLIMYLYRSNFREFTRVNLLFFLPMLIIMLTIELIMQLVDKSFLQFIISSSTTINQGSSNEGIAYLAIYFYFVEKWYGVLILILFVVGLYNLFANKANNKASIVALIGISAYFIYGFYVYFFQSMVFYGRILHMYYPFIIITCLIFIQGVKLNTRKVIIFSLIVLASINYYQVIKDLNSIAYPINIAIDYKLNSSNVTYSSVTELKCLYDIDDINSYKLYNDTKSTNLLSGKYILLNFCFFHHYPDVFFNKYQKFNDMSNLKRIFSKKHFMSHPAYTFEYCTQTGRKFFIDKSFNIRIFEAY